MLGGSHCMFYCTNSIFSPATASHGYHYPVFLHQARNIAGTPSFKELPHNSISGTCTRHTYLYTEQGRPDLARGLVRRQLGSSTAQTLETRCTQCPTWHMSRSVGGKHVLLGTSHHSKAACRAGHHLGYNLRNRPAKAAPASCRRQCGFPAILL